MGDISTWDPVDNSNTTAPPDGWPEGMAPSAVNNSARAMMGAVRRWYDTLTAQLASITTSLGNYVLKSGDTMTGTLSAPQYNISGFVLATHNSGTGYHLIYDAAGEVSLLLGSTDTQYRADQHSFQNNAGAVRATLDASGNFTATGTVTAAQLTSTGNINAAGTVTGTSFIGNVSVPASGPVTTGGTVTGGQVTSTGNINASGNITGVNLIGTEVFLGGHLAFDGSTPGQLGIFTTSGDMAIALFGSPTYQNAYYNNTHAFENSGRDFTYAEFTIAGCFNVSGTWGTFSDASLKDDVAPYERGLEAILGLSPISFRYLAGTPFADPERTLRYGLMAQDVAGIIPEMVGETTLVEGQDAVGTVFPGHLVYVLVNSCKELAAQNAALAARIEALEATQQ